MVTVNPARTAPSVATRQVAPAPPPRHAPKGHGRRTQPTAGRHLARRSSAHRPGASEQPQPAAQGRDEALPGAAAPAPRAQEFQALLAQLQPLAYTELQQLQAAGAADSEGGSQHPAFTASFLFWLSAQEKAAHGARKQELANLAAQLVYIKEHAEFEASRRQLPPLASSLAFSNYSTWRADHEGEELPEVAPGVSLTDLYKAAEREEAKLKRWQAPQRPSSTLDGFAAASGYQQMAADAMARVRARLMGFEDDDTLQQPRQRGQEQEQQQPGDAGPPLPRPAEQQQRPSRVSPAAERVLDELLLTCCCREERATLLPEAFVPPGLEVSASGSTLSSSSSGGGSGAKARVVTAPQRLLEAIAARLESIVAKASGASQAETGGQQQQQQELLPSGEGVAQALQQLREDVQDYDEHVYSRMSRRDLQGL